MIIIIPAPHSCWLFSVLARIISLLILWMLVNLFKRFDIRQKNIYIFSVSYNFCYLSRRGSPFLKPEKFFHSSFEDSFSVKMVIWFFRNNMWTQKINKSWHQNILKVKMLYWKLDTRTQQNGRIKENSFCKDSSNSFDNFWLSWFVDVFITHDECSISYWRELSEFHKVNNKILKELNYLPFLYLIDHRMVIL